MREFKDPRLKCHIVTVLKSIPVAQPKARLDSPQNSALEFNEGIPEDLFSILAACEKHKSPSSELLAKSKELQWPLLAVVASCFDDANPTFCLTAWLEIAAARFVLLNLLLVCIIFTFLRSIFCILFVDMCKIALISPCLPQKAHF